MRLPNATPENSRRAFVRAFVLPCLAALAVLRVLCGAATTRAADDEAFFTLCEKGSPREIAEAIRSGADLNARNVWGRTPLMEAAETGNLAVMTTLLEAGSDVHARDKYGMTPLMLAAQDRFPELTAGLVYAGANVTAEDVEKYALRMKDDTKYWVRKSAVRWNRLPETINALVKAGADVNARDKNGMTSLLLAVQGCPEPKVITALVRAGAKVNAADWKGNTALMFAAQAMEFPGEATNILLDAGANPKAKNRAGKRAIDYARKNKPFTGTEAFKKLEAASH